MNQKLKNIVLASIFLGVSISSLPFVFALTNEEKWKILQNFKAQEKEMIFESDALLSEGGDVLEIYKRLNVFNSIADKVEAKREYLQEQNKRITTRVKSLEMSVAELDQDITNIMEQIVKINQDMVQIQDDIETTKTSIEILKKKIEENTDILMEYLVYIYKKWNTAISDTQIDNIKSILLSGENIDELVNDLYFKSIIQLTGQQLIDKQRKFISELYIKNLDLQKSERDLKAMRKVAVLEKSSLDDKKEAKQRLLDITKGQESLYQKYIAEKLEVERDIKIKELREQMKLNNSKKELLEKYDCDFIDIGTQQAELETASDECQDINKIIYAESRLTQVDLEYNPLDWPISPIQWISAFFRDEEYQELFGEDHDAIDIKAPQGSDVKAPLDGYVIYIQPPVNAGYAYVALKHSDGLVTIYGHVNEVLVEKYQFIEKGEVFARSGGEYGTFWAGILTTGPHLHFAVYEDGEYTDPFELLDLSYLKYESLPDRFQYKYKTDFKLRRGFDYREKTSEDSNVFRIEGDTEMERQKYLLNTYATTAFQNWDTWVEESVSAGIDPTFMMCVGLAETSLGRHLKTPYNIGNVGNTDSWATRNFSSAREWIYWMTKTFNNQYLGDYTKIEQLSRYGNKDGAIYASSEFNWHNNITKCMSHIKGEYVSDDYEFRIQK